MSNELQMTQDFQTRIFNRIRESIGDLMTDEDLKRLVDAAMQRAFFADRIEQESYRQVVRPPHFIKLIDDLMRERVQAEVKQWLEDHPEEVSKAIQETIEKGICGIMASYIDSRASWPLQNLANELRQKGVLG